LPFTTSGQEMQWIYSYNSRAHMGSAGSRMSCQVPIAAFGHYITRSTICSVTNTDIHYCICTAHTERINYYYCFQMLFNWLFVQRLLPVRPAHCGSPVEPARLAGKRFTAGHMSFLSCN